MLNEILQFPITTYSKDELGQTIENRDYKRTVFCRKQSVSQSEFFSAGQSGFKPEVVLIVNTLDYRKELKVKFKDTIFDIYRHYDRPDERTELYCLVKANG